MNINNREKIMETMEERNNLDKIIAVKKCSAKCKECEMYTPFNGKVIVKTTLKISTTIIY
jgi:hypothetical protein